MSETATIDVEVKETADKIVKWTLLQTQQFKSYMKDAYGIEPAAGGAVMVAGPAAGGAAAVEEQTAFDVILKSAGDKKIQVIKTVREATGLGLKEAKDLVDGAPKPIKTGLSKADADALAAKLKEAGGEIEIK